MSIYEQAFDTSPLNHTPAQHGAFLTVSEVGMLWATYMHYSMLTCIFSYFTESARDSATRELMSESLERCITRTRAVTEFLKRDQQPIPSGFSEQDVHKQALPLFADNYLLHYLHHMLRVSLTINSMSLSMASRPDIRDFYIECVESSIRLKVRTDELMLARGLLSRDPVATIAKDVEFVHNPRFLTGFLGEKRPLLTIELAHLYYNGLSNEVARVLLLGFKQVTSLKDVRNYFNKALEITEKYIDRLSQFAQDENIHFAFISDGDVTDSIEAPFSDKLMMFHVNGLTSVGIGMYGVALGASPRHDLAAAYGQMIVEVGKFAEKGVKLSMEKGWLEEPPQVVDREKLAKENH